MTVQKENKIEPMGEDQMKTNSISPSTNIVHDDTQLDDGGTNNIEFIGDQPAKFSIYWKSWAKWKSISDKLRKRLS